MNEIQSVVVEPDVARISEGLRDTGYDFNTAVADIIDNSIAAGSTRVNVQFKLDLNGRPFVSIADNGSGMDRDGLINAMRYGSQERANQASLGKFGMGLKTASTAFSRRLAVISRPSKDETPLEAVWDLDILQSTNSWALQIGVASPEEVDLLNEVAMDSSGTLVVWDRIDRLLSSYKKSDGRPLKNAHSRAAQSLYEHIAMVFQRFLDRDDERAPTVSLSLNERAVTPWDPFCLAETKEPVFVKEIPIQVSGESIGKILVRCFILPRKEEFSSDSNRVAARIDNHHQGVYVYRENRLIHGPDWLGMYRKEIHYSLLRVELSFDHTLDAAFQVDIKKSGIKLNEELHEHIRDRVLAAPRREADNRHRKGVASKAGEIGGVLHANSDSAIRQKASSLKVATIKNVDESTGQVEIQNNEGLTTTKLRIISIDETREVRILTNETLESGVLWEASLINGVEGVVLNTGHPYYQKAYLPNSGNTTIVQALDFLLWALAQAEVNNTKPGIRDTFDEFRVEVSRNLKKLVSDLPDPVEIAGD